VFSDDQGDMGSFRWSCPYASGHGKHAGMMNLRSDWNIVVNTNHADMKTNGKFIGTVYITFRSNVSKEFEKKLTEANKAALQQQQLLQKQIKTLKENHETQMKQKQTEHDTNMKQAKEAFEQKLAEAGKKHESDLKAAQQKFEQDMKQKDLLHQQAMKQLQEKHAAEIKQKNTIIERLESELQRTTTLANEATATTDKLAKAYADLKEDHQELLEFLAMKKAQKAASTIGTQSDLDLCTVCLIAPKRVLLQPCGHIPYCEDCMRKSSEAARHKGIPHECPLCRREVTSTNSPVYV